MKKLIILVTAGSLLACASTDTPRYEMADSDNDYGYYENRITDNRYRVHYNGDRSTDRDDVKDMALLRAAELTKLNDYDWFRVQNQELIEEDNSSTQVSTGVSTGPQAYRSCGLLGCTTTFSPAYSNIQISTMPGRDTYSTSIEIVMGNGEVEDQSSIYNASELYTYLSGRY
jgi:hypothetical protein